MTYGPWFKTFWWLRLLGKPAWMRNTYASWMIGGGWDGWEFSETGE
jgi:hypothetical protein